MANPNPKVENLKSYTPKWQSGKTRTIRVPIAIADEVLRVADKIDKGMPVGGSNPDNSKLIEKLNEWEDYLTQTTGKYNKPRYETERGKQAWKMLNDLKDSLG